MDVSASSRLLTELSLAVLPRGPSQGALPPTASLIPGSSPGFQNCSFPGAAVFAAWPTVAFPAFLLLPASCISSLPSCCPSPTSWVLSCTLILGSKGLDWSGFIANSTTSASPVRLPRGVFPALPESRSGPWPHTGFGSWQTPVCITVWTARGPGRKRHLARRGSTLHREPGCPKHFLLCPAAQTSQLTGLH